MSNMDDEATVGQRIKVVRELRGVGQAKFAKELGVSQTHISKIENGNDNPSKTLIKLISLKYAINEDYLLNGEGYFSSMLEEYVTNDKELMSYYNDQRFWFDDLLKRQKGDDLILIIECFCRFSALIGHTQGQKKENGRIEYLKCICEVLGKICGLMISPFKLEESAKSPAAVLDYKIESDTILYEIILNIKKAVNIYFKNYNKNFRI
ncbi:hypothetical protein FACS1894188_06370 [Clostridia bacterium]|nr:hypothetical protein FACS1894188_06370 [Clostridia bacterium]